MHEAQEITDFLSPRRCMREPIAEICEASRLLDRAVDAHLIGDQRRAEDLIAAANMPAVRQWTESLWGSKKANPNNHEYHRFRQVEGMPPYLSKSERVRQRMPTKPERLKIIERYGRNCVFCGIPLISREVRIFLRSKYPNALHWGSRNETQHAAFQCMWLQYDHVLPHCRGGGNDIENVVVTCAPCNYGRWYCTLEEVGLIDPRLVSNSRTSWDGLERVISPV